MYRLGIDIGSTTMKQWYWRVCSAEWDQAGGKRTMNAYLCSLECAAYDEQHSRG